MSLVILLVTLPITLLVIYLLTPLVILLLPSLSLSSFPVTHLLIRLGTFLIKKTPAVGTLPAVNRANTTTPTTTSLLVTLLVALLVTLLVPLFVTFSHPSSSLLLVAYIF